jgi:hypothetical protein
LRVVERGRIAQGRFHFSQAAGEFVDVRAEIHGHCHGCGKKESARKARSLCGRKMSGQLGLLLFGSGFGDGLLGGLGLGHALLEFVHAARGIDEFLLASVEGVAGVANTEENGVLGRAGLDHVAACATNFRRLILRMNVSFHNKGSRSYQPIPD